LQEIADEIVAGELDLVEIGAVCPGVGDFGRRWRDFGPSASDREDHEFVWFRGTCFFIFFHLFSRSSFFLFEPEIRQPRFLNNPWNP